MHSCGITVNPLLVPTLAGNDANNSKCTFRAPTSDILSSILSRITYSYSLSLLPTTPSYYTILHTLITHSNILPILPPLLLYSTLPNSYRSSVSVDMKVSGVCDPSFMDRLTFISSGGGTLTYAVAGRHHYILSYQHILAYQHALSTPSLSILPPPFQPIVTHLLSTPLHPLPPPCYQAPPPRLLSPPPRLL